MRSFEQLIVATEELDNSLGTKVNVAKSARLNVAGDYEPGPLLAAFEARVSVKYLVTFGRC